MNNDLQTNQVDELGMLLAQIKDLTAKADGIKDGIKDSASLGGAKVVEGAIFKATYSEANVATVDYKKMMADLGISVAKIAEYTTSNARFTVKVTSR